MNSLIRNINIYWRSERLLAEAEWRRTSRQFAHLAIAGVFALLTLVMLNVAAFYWLVPTLGSAQAALAVAAVDFLIAAILVVLAQSLKPAPETELIRELRNEALADIEAEAKAVETQLIHIRNDVKSIGATVRQIASDPVGSLSPALLVPAINAFTKVVRSKK